MKKFVLLFSLLLVIIAGCKKDKKEVIETPSLEDGFNIKYEFIADNNGYYDIYWTENEFEIYKLEVIHGTNWTKTFVATDSTSALNFQVSGRMVGEMSGTLNIYIGDRLAKQTAMIFLGGKSYGTCDYVRNSRLKDVANPIVGTWAPKNTEIWFYYDGKLVESFRYEVGNYSLKDYKKCFLMNGKCALVTNIPQPSSMLHVWKSGSYSLKNNTLSTRLNRSDVIKTDSIAFSPARDSLITIKSIATIFNGHKELRLDKVFYLKE